MRTATCIIGEKSNMTVGDLKKILKRMDDSAPVHVPQEMGGTYNVSSEDVAFDENKIVIGG